MAIIISYFHIFMASAFFMMCLHMREYDTWVVWFKFHETIIRWVLISDGLVRITHPFRVKMYHYKSSSQSWNLKPYFICWKLETQPKHPKNYTQHPSNKHTEHTHGKDTYEHIYIKIEIIYGLSALTRMGMSK